MRKAIMTAASLLLGAAAPASYVQICTAPCVAQDGTTQPAGTVLNRAVWIKPPARDATTEWQPDQGQALYHPVRPTQEGAS
ncbi:Hypothetical protein GbCGDNIH9_5068 [Granulibacter bethesdensis]|uniref:Secreted protein n=1 Tax=Granulibacter bethesdensis TaxID=364410 RepID=A0AAC9KBJ5_9PROT|nr:hypothetical protein [Granulibacter bethesdensis]APH54834.1 Hypothetical protein GbCGDNIH9_5068 [Granulibacter bethesdensis]APH62420.1 Hypothetical protein GbCGDNIH8_5068 [Granulibacter bethesdensis]